MVDPGKKRSAICHHCGKNFVIRTSRNPNLFCSNRCRARGDKRAWRPEQDTFLKENYYRLTTSELADSLNRSHKAILKHAFKLEITKDRRSERPATIRKEPRKTLSATHRDRLRVSIRNWWELNRDNEPLQQERSRRISLALKGNTSALKGRATGRHPPNTGQRTGEYKVCEICRKEFYVLPSGKTRRFCSQGCFGVFLKDNWWGLHPKSPWTRYRLLRVKKACEVCGFNDSRILMMHHKDGNRGNNPLENLIVLCPNHHMLAHLTNGKLDLRGWHKMLKEHRKELPRLPSISR